MTAPLCIELFADGSPTARRRLHVLLALADVEDVATRRAAGGALAMVTEYDGAVRGILELERGVMILLELCMDDDDGCVHRGVVAVRNLVCTEGDMGYSATRRVKEEGGVDVLKSVLSKTRMPAVLEVGVEALKKLVD